MPLPNTDSQNLFCELVIGYRLAKYSYYRSKGYLAVTNGLNIHLQVLKPFVHVAHSSASAVLFILVCRWQSFRTVV